VIEDHSDYSSKDGVMFNKDKTELIRYPASKKGAYRIPNSVTSIGSMAFANCVGLTSVTIPNSVTKIRIGAFDGCTGLTSVIIPNSVTSISAFTFRDCSNLTSVIIPNSVTFIGAFAFRDCSNLTSIRISNGTTKIGEGAFKGCVGLTSVTIPNSVTEIAREAFEDCVNLTSITVLNPIPPILSGKNRLKYISTIFDIIGYRHRTTINSHITLYVPKGSVDAYSDVWREAKSIQEIPDNFEDISDLSENESDAYEYINDDMDMWITLSILSALGLSVAVFVIINTRKNKNG